MRNFGESMQSSCELQMDPLPSVASELEAIREKLALGKRLTREDGLTLFRCPDVLSVGALAEWFARKQHGERVFYCVNGHINYSNYCTLSCAFCSFYRRKEKDKRAQGYEMTLE